MLKKRSEKLLMLILLSMLVFNFIGTNVVTAATTTTGGTFTSKDGVQYDMSKVVGSTTDHDAEIAIAEQMDWGNVAGGALDGIVGMLTYFERFKVLIVGGICQFLGTVVAESAGATEKITVISPEDILFNKLAITDINFFKMNTYGSTNASLSGDHNPIKMLKQNVARWYMTLRAIALVILLAVLIYIGIRMAMTSVASEKAEYKKMLMNWVVSLALVFLLHYIIVFVLNINNAFVNILGSLSGANVDNNFMSKYFEQLVFKCFDPRFTIGWSSAILYVCVVALTFIFLIMYIKRMITIAFLILVSPIITITYSIDKVGDGKAQAFSAWLKEFLHNVLIQPFHCLIYLAFTSVAMNLLQNTATLASTLLVVLTMFFILESEKLIKKIFGIDSESTGNAMATAAVLSTAYGKLSPGKDKGGKAVPTNNGGGATPPPAGSAARTRVATNVAANNMNAVTGTAAGIAPVASGMAVANNHSPYSSENLSAKLSGGQAHVDDYDALMGNEKPKLTAEQKLAQAEADDYNALMGYDSDNNNNTQTVQPQRNRVYGIPGRIQPQQAQTNSQQQLPTRKEYGWLGTQPGEPEGPSAFDKAKGVAGKTWGVVKKSQSYADGLAGAVIGGSLSGIGGANIAETMGAMAVGSKVQHRVEDKISEGRQKITNYFDEKEIAYNEQELANSFSKYKNGEQYKPEDVNRAQDYLKMTKEQVSNIPDRSQKQYVQSLHATRDVLSKKYKGEELDQRVTATLHKVVNKEIVPELEE